MAFREQRTRVVRCRGLLVVSQYALSRHPGPVPGCTVQGREREADVFPSMFAEILAAPISVSSVISLSVTVMQNSLTA